MRCRLIATTMLAASVSSRVAHAHVAPAVLGVVAEENGAPVAVRLAHGLAQLDEQSRWRFVCPRTWEAPDSPLALEIEERRIAVVAASHAWELNPAGIAEPRLAPGVTTLNARKLARGGGAVFALASQGDSAIIVRFELGSSTPVLSATTSFHSITATEDRFELARVTSTRVHVESYAHDGSSKRAIDIEHATPPGSTIAIERTGGELYAVLATHDDWTLARLDLDTKRVIEIATSTTPILGPIERGDNLYAVINQKLARLDAANDTLAIEDESQTHTCASAGHVCRRTTLHALTANGADASPSFDIASIKGPRLAHFEENARLACLIEWQDFAREAGLDPALPDEPISPNSPPNSGCSCGATPSFSGWGYVLLIALIFAGRARRRRR